MKGRILLFVTQGPFANKVAGLFRPLWGFAMTMKEIHSVRHCERSETIQKNFPALFLLLLGFPGFFSVFATTLPQANKIYPSLFFTEEEMPKKRGIQQKSLNFETPSLSGILYYDESHWTLWINDQIIRPENTEELRGFNIDKVAPQEVQFSQVSPEGKILRTFTLQPH